MDRDHHEKQRFLRTLGPGLVVAGVVFTAIGLISFFASFDSFETPRYFWCAFIGLPLLGAGAKVTKFAYLGAVSRYVANEVAPIGTDTIRYVAEGTRGAVRDIAAAVGAGLREGQEHERSDGAGAPEALPRCERCDQANDADATFCKHCGTALAKPERCSDCGEVNDPDANFCDGCGRPLARDGRGTAARTSPPAETQAAAEPRAAVLGALEGDRAVDDDVLDAGGIGEGLEVGREGAG